jgi:hypothetical protein
MSPIDSAASVVRRWSVDVFHLACTAKKLLDIFGCALKFGCKFAFETDFCEFDLWNDPISQFLLLHIVCLVEMRILSYQASLYISPVPRYARKRLGWKFPMTSPKEGILGITPSSFVSRTCNTVVPSML